MCLMTLDNFLNEFATEKVDYNCKYDVEVLKEDLLTDVWFPDAAISSFILIIQCECREIQVFSVFINILAKAW